MNDPSREPRDPVYRVDIQHGPAMVGEGNIQVIATYNSYTIYSTQRGTWADSAAPPPLAAGAGAPVESPYRGLAAFGERDAGLFFGREEAARQVLERMSRRADDPGPLLVSGVSGAGKSSLLRAGVLPRIRRTGLAGAPEAAGWPCLVLNPGRDPLAGLAVGVASLTGADAATTHQALVARPADFALTARQAADQAEGVDPPGQPAVRRGRRLLLVIDQFEQIFTQCRGQDQRMAFLTALRAAVTSGHDDGGEPAAMVVLVVRADFEARCADYEFLADAVQDRYLLLAMTERQLRMAITEPARKAGAHVDDGLVSALLGDVRGAGPALAGVLPLLSYVLDKAWRARTGPGLTLADYDRAGGIEGAVADSAERAYARLTPAQRNAARAVFLRLTATSPDGTVTADRATRAELLPDKDAARARDVEAVLEAFTAQRLLTLGAGTVEISHEVLLSAWPLLRDEWLADTQSDRVVRTRLRAVAGDWSGSGRDPSYLYKGRLLDDAVATAARAGHTRQPELSPVEQEFLRASSRARRRSAVMWRGALAVLIAVTVGLAATALIAYRASQNAARQRDIAVASQLVTQSEALSGASPAVSRIESLAAWRIDPTAQSRYALISAASRPGIAVLASRAGPVYSVAFSPDGRTLAIGGHDGTAQLWSVHTLRRAGSVGPPVSSVGHAVAFSPKGRILATTDQGGTAELWDVATHQQVGQPLVSGTRGFCVGDSPVPTEAWSRNGHLLAVPAGSSAVVWNVATREKIVLPAVSPLQCVTGVALSPDGRILATGSGNGTVRLWDVATRRQIGPALATGDVDAVVAFSPGGTTLATGGDGGRAELWNVATRHPIGKPLTGDTGSVNAVAFSPDGQTLATGEDGGQVQLWDVATHQQIGQPLTGGTGSVTAVAFSPDGQTLATGSDNGTARLWDVGRQIGTPLTGHIGSVDAVAFGPGGHTLAAGSWNGKLLLWNMASRQPAGQPLAASNPGDSVDFRPVGALAFSPDGRILATGTWDGTARLWNVATRRQIGRPLTGYRGMYTVAFSPHGRILVTADSDGALQWNAATHKQIGRRFGTGIYGDTAALSPDGRILVIGTFDGTARLWNMATRRQIGTPLAGGTGQVSALAFSPDGRILATGTEDGTVQLWNVATHRQTGQPLSGPPGGGSVTAVAFSPDGQTLAVVSNGGLQLWDVATGQRIGQQLTGTGAIYSAAFSPDGRVLAAGTSGGVRLWDVTAMGRAPQTVCAQAGGLVTRAEWSRYVPAGPPYSKVC